MSKPQDLTVPQRVDDLVARMEATARLPLSSQERAANVLLEWSEARELFPELREYCAGYVQEHTTLVRKVGVMLSTFTAASSGAAFWRTELPPGKAPAFRRALNALVKHMRERLRDG